MAAAATNEDNIRHLMRQLSTLIPIYRTQSTDLNAVGRQLDQLVAQIDAKVDDIRKNFVSNNDDKRLQEDVTNLWESLKLIEQTYQALPNDQWLQLRYRACQLLFLILVGLNLVLHSATAADPKTPLLSVKDEMTLRLATSRILKWLAEPVLLRTSCLRVANTLFPIGDGSDVVEVVDEDEKNFDLNQQYIILKRIYTAMVALFTFSCRHGMNLVGELLRRDYYPLMLILFAIGRQHRREQPTAITKFEQDLEQQFEQANFDLPNQMFVIRDLLLVLNKCRPNLALLRFFTMMLSKHFTQPDGLQLVLNSVLDSELSSERETTILHRLQAIVTVIVHLRVKDQEQYLRQILHQVRDSLLPMEQPNKLIAATAVISHPVDIFWRFGALLLKAIDASHPALTLEVIFKPMWTMFEDGDNNNSIDQILLIVKRLLSIRACLDKAAAPMFAPIFYIGHWWHAHTTNVVVSRGRRLVDEILVSALKEIPQSIHLLHDCVNNEEKATKWANRWALVVDDSGDTIEHRLAFVKDRPTQAANDNEDRLDGLAQFIMKILDRMSEDYRFDYFFILLGELSESPRPAKITLELIELLSGRLFGPTITKQQETRQENILLGCRRTVRFLAVTFERIVNRLVQLEAVQVDDDEDEAIERHAQDISLFLDTLTMCLQILKILLEKINEEEQMAEVVVTGSDKSTEVVTRQTILIELKPCYTSLGVLRRSKQVQQWIEMTNKALSDEASNAVPSLDQLHLQMEQLYSDHRIEQLLAQGEPSSASSPADVIGARLRQLVAETRHQLMPMRAHALIELRQLIVSHNRQFIVDQFDLLVETLQACLMDPESYVYMAAINTLGGLAIERTQEVLPLLFREFRAPTRPLAVRLKTGEVLLRVAASIGDLAYHHAPLFIGQLVAVTASATNEPAIQVSALSLLGEYCSRFSLGRSKYMIELMNMAERLLRSPSSQLEVKRAVAVFLRYLLRGVTNREMAAEVGDHLKVIKEAIVFGQQSTIDPILRRHCQLAFAEIHRIVHEVLLEGIED